MSNEPDIMEPTYWRKNGFTARVIKNEDDDGWAVEIHQIGNPEPALKSPWVMGRDKKNPKPFDAQAFATFVKTASEVIDRAARQNDAKMNRQLNIACDGVWYKVTLRLVADEYEPHAILSAMTDEGNTVASYRVATTYKFTRDAANAWAQGGFAEP